MSFARRHRVFVLLLAALGVLGQLWMPTAHALSMAQATGTGAAAYCGAKNSALGQKLRDVAPPELRAVLEQSGEIANTHDDDCPPCAGCVYSFAVPPPVSPLSFLTQNHPALLFPNVAPIRPVLAAPPPARGPPSSS